MVELMVVLVSGFFAFLTQVYVGSLS